MKALGSVASGLAALSLMCGTAHAETDVLYGSFAPATSAFTKGFFEPWIEEIENLTDGSVKFQFIPGGGVVDMKTALGGVRDGVVDGAFYVTVSHASELPILYMLSELIGMGASNASRLGAFNQFVIQDCPECQAELKKWNEVFLGGYSLSDYYLFCTKSVQTEDDFNGLRVRATPPYSRLFAAAGDIVPVTVTVTESYEALQRGLADCHAGPASTYLTYSFIDIADYVIELNSGASFGGTVFNFNRDKWAEFSSDQREAILRATADASAHGAMTYSKEDAEALEAAKANGKHIVKVDAVVADALGAWIADNKTAAAERGKERGIANAQEIIDRFLPYIERWNELLPNGDDEKKIAQTYWDEIYAKFPTN